MFYRPFREATKVIGISPVKDHNLCKATVTMKNWYGLLGNPRNQFHQNIHGIISDFALMMKPTLVIADGRKLLMSQRAHRRQPQRRQEVRHHRRGDRQRLGRLLVRHPPARQATARDHLPRQGDRPRPGQGLAAPVDPRDQRMSVAPRQHPVARSPRREPIALMVPRESGLLASAGAFWRLCLANPLLRLERTARGEVIVMAPACMDSGWRNGS